MGFFKIFNRVDLCPYPKVDEKLLNPEIKLNSYLKQENIDNCLIKANQIINGYLFYFGEEKYFVDNKPNWFYDYKNKAYFQDSKFHWSECNVFSKGDIKQCWEISRWTWAVTLSRAFKLSGDKKYIYKYNELAHDWCINNAVNRGINWNCGQETSLRLINFLLSWKILFSGTKNGKLSFSNDQIDFVSMHLRRINQTMFYAKAQNNNHWISESAALFIGGSWLMQTSNKNYSRAKKWASIGRKNLEISLKKLVMADGSFSQHSLTYHRLVLDLLCQVEIWRAFFKLQSFSAKYKEKFSLLTEWFHSFIDEESGDGPNLGANDGAYCFQLHDLPYRDFRPTLQLSIMLSDKYKNTFLTSGLWDEPLYWLDLKKKNIKNSNSSYKFFRDGGYIVMKTNDSSSWALLRLPKYFIRPSHNDPLHFDLWHRGMNILRDGGSYSYNISKNINDYFTGIKSHNSIEFKDAQMLRLSRFLLGNKIIYKNKVINEFKNNYSKCLTKYSFNKNSHSREVIFKKDSKSWEITDNFLSSNKQIILRWRVIQSDWKKTKEFEFKSSLAKLAIFTNSKIISCNLVKGFESRNYGIIQKLPVVEVIISGYEGKIKTIINPI